MPFKDSDWAHSGSWLTFIPCLARGPYLYDHDKAFGQGLHFCQSTSLSPRNAFSSDSMTILHLAARISSAEGG